MENKLEKNSLTIEPADTVSFNFQKQEIKVFPYVSVTNKQLFMHYYLDAMVEDKPLDVKYLQAEYTIVLAIVDNLTNISITDLDIDLVISSGLWDKIKSRIVNYDEFKSEINEVVKMMREDVALEKSIGTVLDKTSASITNFLSNISNVDLSKEGVSKILEALNFEKNELNKIVDPSKVTEPVTPKKKAKKEILQ
jgi:hypothetical protein